MSSRPAGLGDRWNRRLGGMSTKHMRLDPVQADQDAAAGAERARAAIAAASERIHHPAIKAPEFKCYRVIRRWESEECGEDIGFARTEAEACRLMNREQGWAIVVNPNNRRVAYNFQPMETR